MAVLEATRMWSRDSFEAESEKGFRTNAKIIEAYQIVVDPDTTKVEVAEAAGVPQRNTPYTGVPSVICKRRSFERVSPILWIATLNYEGGYGPAGPASRPETSPPEISWTDAESNELIDEDADGNPIVTANGEPIEGITMPISDNVLVVRRMFRYFNPYLTNLYRHSVNSDVFASYPPGTARLTKYRADQVWNESTNGWWMVTANVQFRVPYNTTPEKAWYARVRHEGFHVRVDDMVIRAVDDNKEPVTRPVQLKADGTRETDPTVGHWKEFKRYQPLSYNALGLI